MKNSIAEKNELYLHKNTEPVGDAQVGGYTTPKKKHTKYIASEVETINQEKISMNVINYEVKFKT